LLLFRSRVVTIRSQPTEGVLFAVAATVGHLPAAELAVFLVAQRFAAWSSIGEGFQKLAVI